MHTGDQRTLRQVLREAVRALRMSNRALEDVLGIGHGNLEKLLSGKLDLRVRHLTAFAELMKVPVEEIMAAGFPGSAAEATRHLDDWIGKPPAAGEARAAARLPPTLEEIRELLREEIRSEMARAGRGRRRDAAAE